jgi:hypothetical protein
VEQDIIKTGGCQSIDYDFSLEEGGLRVLVGPKFKTARRQMPHEGNDDEFSPCF